MDHDKCAGEVFIALFDYLNTELNINIRGSMAFKEIGEHWRETTGDYDMIAFLEAEKAAVLSLADSIDYDAVSQYVNDFFQNDYGDAGEIACHALLDYLGTLHANTVLIFRLS